MAAGLLPQRAAAADFKSDALCIMCIDPRCVYSTIRFLDDAKIDGGLGIPGVYDMVALAGASLAGVSLAFPTSIGAIWDHIALARKLHDIDRVVVMDHRDCGAFKAVYGSDPPELHKQVMTQMKTEFVRRYPRNVSKPLGLEFYLMPVSNPPKPPPYFLRPVKIDV
ncbi:MAG TPA: hypothetical protein VMH86_03530 [Rhizomicrobium sp.]|nr:hypothetical protein [Rhizomicrobium sp.]